MNFPLFEPAKILKSCWRWSFLEPPGGPSNFRSPSQFTSALSFVRTVSNDHKSEIGPKMGKTSQSNGYKKPISSTKMAQILRCIPIEYPIKISYPIEFLVPSPINPPRFSRCPCAWSSPLRAPSAVQRRPPDFQWMRARRARSGRAFSWT